MSLKQKKYRQQHNLFVVEGKKTIVELLQSNLKLHQLYTTTLEFKVMDDLVTQISTNELKKISFLKTPNKVVAIFKIPEEVTIDFSSLVVALDDVRDPGNLGTIIRLCDWFGVKDLICSHETVDCYNPKVVQATMGSIARVNVSYVDLEKIIKAQNVKIFGAFMDGDNVYDLKLPNSGMLLLGNEANGISQTAEKLVTNRISIPRFGEFQETESLNVANATAILLSEFKRKSTEM